MDFGLERLERNTLSIYAYIPVTSTFRDNSIAENFAIPNARVVEQLAVSDREHHFESRDTGDVAVDTDEVHVAIIRER